MDINALLNQFIGNTQTSEKTGGNNQQAGGLAQSLTGGLPENITSKIPGGLAGGLAAGGILGLLVGNKKARKTVGKMAGGAVGLGGAAVLGALAFNAYNNWQQNKPSRPASAAQAPTHDHANAHTYALPQPSPENFAPDAKPASDGAPFQLALLKAMIAASNADGHIDGNEQKAIFEAVDKFQLTLDEKALIFDILRAPPSVDTIAGYANGLEQATELYLVSRLAIDPDHPLEAAYLQTLAEKLELPSDLVSHLEQQVVQS